jgi:hypothetical protein
MHFCCELLVPVSAAAHFCWLAVVHVVGPPELLPESDPLLLPLSGAASLPELLPLPEPPSAPEPLPLPEPLPEPAS